MKNTNLVLALFLSIASFGQEINPPIHVQKVGEGKPVLLIPGFTVPGESWDATVNHLKANFQCHVVTLAGFGGMAPIDFPWLPKVNAALEDYINEHQLTDVTIIGHSLGGIIATWLASRDDNSISKLILVDALPAAGALMIPDFNPDNLAYESPFNNQQLALSDAQFEQMASAMSKGMSINTEAQERIKEWIVQADRKTYVYGYTDYLKLDMREDLKNISVPVTIIAAEKPFGKETVLSNFKSQYANLSSYDVILAEDSAHFVMFDKPDWFIAQIQQLLDSN